MIIVKYNLMARCWISLHPFEAQGFSISYHFASTNLDTRNSHHFVSVIEIEPNNRGKSSNMDEMYIKFN